jgi:hypothetical protein
MADVKFVELFKSSLVTKSHVSHNDPFTGHITKFVSLSFVTRKALTEVALFSNIKYYNKLSAYIFCSVFGNWFNQSVKYIYGLSVTNGDTHFLTSFVMIPDQIHPVAYCI